MKFAPRRLAVKKLALTRFAPRKDAFCAERRSLVGREESVVFMAIVIGSVGKGYERDAAEIEPRSSGEQAEVQRRAWPRELAESWPSAGRGATSCRCCEMKRMMMEN